MAKHTITEAVAKDACKELGLSFGAKIGEGAFKQVFRVTNSHGVVQALKLTDPSAYSERTNREVSLLSACTHPSIAKFFGSGKLSTGAAASLHYSLEEFLSGGTLTDRLATGLLTAADAKLLATDVVEALSYLDSIQRKCVHRDIKPDNIMYRSPGGKAVLVDFGIARMLTELSLTQSWMPRGPGTPYFASPEQLLNTKALIDWRSDQFSLGVTLSISCFGLHPFQEQTEPNGLPDIVQRVARRGAFGSWFAKRCQDSGLNILVQMTQVWPAQRVRFHADLLGALK